MHNLRMKYVDSKKGEFKHEVRQFQKPYDNQQAEQTSLMVEQLQKHVPAKGRPPKLSIEDQILLCLSYWREYRTLFHVATSYGVSEPTASRIVRHVEDCLIRSNLFNLPKDLPEGEGIDWNVVIVDATEIPIQRPKNRRKAIAARKRPTLSKYRPSFIIKLKNPEFMYESWCRT